MMRSFVRTFSPLFFSCPRIYMFLTHFAKIVRCRQQICQKVAIHLHNLVNVEKDLLALEGV